MKASVQYKLKDKRYDPYRQLYRQEQQFKILFMFLILTAWVFYAWVAYSLKTF